jgi:hypothetical protein
MTAHISREAQAEFDHGVDGEFAWFAANELRHPAPGFFESGVFEGERGDKEVGEQRTNQVENAEDEK